MEENIAEYELLRENILHIEDRITNEVIYMYVTYFALLAISSIWDNWLSLISFIDLIIFQSMINTELWGLKKSSIYINVFFETKRNDLHWELMHINPSYDSAYSKINKGLGWYICKGSSSFLAIVSFLVILIPILHLSNWNFCAISDEEFAKIVLSLVLCALAISINEKYFRIRDDKTVDDQLFDLIKNFYKNISAPDICTYTITQD